MAAAATTRATTRAGAIRMPCITSGSSEMNSGNAAGMPPKRRGASPRITAPSPRVTMMTLISGRPTSRRSTTRLKASASATMPAPAKARAPAGPNPAACSPTAARREPYITHSPSAKLIMPDAL
jgi:hypothetical protein